MTYGVGGTGAIPEASTFVAPVAGTRIYLRRSDVQSKKPSVGAASYGELFVNYHSNSPMLCFKDNADQIVTIKPGASVGTGENPPTTGNQTGDLWWKDPNLLVWDGVAWVQVGASQLNDLSDVDTSGAANGQLLQYDSSTSKWVPGAPGAVVVNLGYTEAADKGTVTNDSGNNAVIPLANGVNAGLSINNYTADEKSKLSGIEAGAEVNVEPTIAYNVVNNGVDGTLTINPGGDTAIIDNATTASAGLMTKGDKAKLDGITDPTISYIPGSGGQGGTLQLNPGGDTAVIGLVTSAQNGLMIGTDKDKLDDIEAGAEVNVKPDWNADSTADNGISNKPDLSVYLTDAPSDGKQYARKDASWTLVTGGGGGGGGDLQSVLEAGNVAISSAAFIEAATLKLRAGAGGNQSQIQLQDSAGNSQCKMEGTGLAWYSSGTYSLRQIYEDAGVYSAVVGHRTTYQGGYNFVNNPASPCFVGGKNGVSSITTTTTIDADGNATFAGEITTQGGAGGPYLRVGETLEILLEPEDDANYTTTEHSRTIINPETHEPEVQTWETRRYTGPVYDIKERLMKTDDALKTLRTAVEDATTVAELKNAIATALAPID